MQSSRVRLVLLASGLLVAGCSNTDDGVRPCDLWTASAVISGHVTYSAGGAAANRPLMVQVASMSGCNGSEAWAHAMQTVTDPAGNYSVKLDLGNSKGIRCVRVTESGSGTSAKDEVEFVGGCWETRPPGQLTVNLVVP